MHVQQGVVDAAAVNIANVNTAGFRRAVPVMRGFQMLFADEISRSPGRVTQPVTGGGADLEATYSDLRPGVLRPTGRPLDVALEGAGFFVVESPTGFQYTRAGHFQLNGRGEVVTPDGHAVLGQSGPIVVDGTQVQITDDGSVIVDGIAVDRLQVVEFPDPQQLLRVGHTRFRAPGAVEAQRVDATETIVHGGHLENANLNLVEELVYMIAAQRGYEFAARSVRVVDRTLGVAVQDIARA